jgi:hypothetical protein
MHGEGKKKMVRWDKGKKKKVRWDKGRNGEKRREWLIQ